MSPRDKKAVLKLVKKCRVRFPSANKKIVRAIIQAEHPKLFDKTNNNYWANKQQLTRCLKESFDIDRQVVHLKNEIAEANTKKSKLVEELLIKMKEAEELRRRLKDADPHLNWIGTGNLEEEFNKLQKFLEARRDEKELKEWIEQHKKQSG